MVRTLRTPLPMSRDISSDGGFLGSLTLDNIIPRTVLTLFTNSQYIPFTFYTACPWRLQVLLLLYEADTETTLVTAVQRLGQLRNTNSTAPPSFRNISFRFHPAAKRAAPTPVAEVVEQ